MAGLSFSGWGPVDAPVLVLLHGFMGSGNDWATIANALPEFRVLAPDLPGHGESTGLPVEAYTLDGAADRCARLKTVVPEGIPGGVHHQPRDKALPTTDASAAVNAVDLTGGAGIGNN